MVVPVGVVRNVGVTGLRRRTLRLTSRSSSTSTDQIEPQPPPAVSAPAPVDTNVSGLKAWHRRRYHGREPLVTEETQHLAGLRVQRRIWAQYGARTGISPAIGWPVREEWEDKMEYEALASPDTLQEMVRKYKEERRAKEEAIQERMDAIDAKMANLEKWKREIIEKKRKKEKELQSAREKHDQLIEEVKEYLGFKVDTKDPRFKEILEKKELEEKKRAKEAKKKEKQAKAIAKLRQMTEDMMDKEKSVDGA